MKNLRNLFLVLALTCSYAMADGHSGSGNRCDSCPPCIENCLDGGEENSTSSAEVTLNEEANDDSTTSQDWSEWFFELIGYREF